MVKLTSQLSHSTRIAQTVAALQSHDNPDVCALSKLITSAWSTQLAEERQRQALKSKTGPKPKRAQARLVARRVGVPTVCIRVCEGLSVL